MKNLKFINPLTKKIAALFLMVIVFCIQINAQDIITLKTGDAILAKILEVSDTEIKYKNFDNIDGPIRVINSIDVFSIKYQNGTITIINGEPKPVVKSAPIPKPAVNSDGFDNDSSDYAKSNRKRFGGPRIGVTYIFPGTTSDYLADKGKNPIISQFGWQFEQRLFTIENGPSGLVEFVPLIGGIEQGLFIPSANILIGIRGGKKRTYEFATGPHFSVTPDYRGDFEPSVGLVIALGTSFVKGNVNFPITLAFVPSVGKKGPTRDPATGFWIGPDKTYQSGYRLSLLVGFNSRKK